MEVKQEGLQEAEVKVVVAGETEMVKVQVKIISFDSTHRKSLLWFKMTSYSKEIKHTE